MLAVITLHSMLSLLMKGENIRTSDDLMETRMSEAGVVKTIKAVNAIGDAVQSQVRSRSRPCLCASPKWYIREGSSQSSVILSARGRIRCGHRDT